LADFFGGVEVDGCVHDVGMPEHALDGEDVSVGVFPYGFGEGVP
jgi:hypothetical protein